MLKHIGLPAAGHSGQRLEIGFVLKIDFTFKMKMKTRFEIENEKRLSVPNMEIENENPQACIQNRLHRGGLALYGTKSAA